MGNFDYLYLPTLYFKMNNSKLSDLCMFVNFTEVDKADSNGMEMEEKKADQNPGVSEMKICCSIVLLFINKDTPFLVTSKQNWP